MSTFEKIDVGTARRVGVLCFGQTIGNALASDIDEADNSATQANSAPQAGQGTNNYAGPDYPAGSVQVADLDGPAAFALAAQQSPQVAAALGASPQQSGDSGNSPAEPTGYSQDAAGNWTYTYPSGATTLYNPDTEQWSSPAYTYPDGTVTEYNTATGQWSAPMEQVVVTGSLNTNNAANAYDPYPVDTEIEQAAQQAGQQVSNWWNGTGYSAPPLTQAERNYAAQGNRAAFWSSRLAHGDPLAATALNIVNNNGVEAQIANGELNTAIAERQSTLGDMGLQDIENENNQIGVDLMQGYAGLVDDNDVNPQSIADLHSEVFANHGLPASTYGGSLFTGSSGIAVLAAPLYLNSR